LPEPTTQIVGSPAKSLPARLANVFVVPSEVFDEVKRATPSPANWLVPALIFILVGWGGVALVFSQESIRQQLSELTAQAIQKQIDKLHATPEQAERMREAGEKFAGLSQKIGAVMFAPVAAFAAPFFWGLVFWLVGTKALKRNFSYMKAVEVDGLCEMIDVLGAFLKTMLILIMGDLFASPSLALLLKEGNPQDPLHVALGFCNAMTLWLLTVRAIGLARLTGVSTGKAAAWVFCLWGLFAGLIIGRAALA
jgi:hypothetical protein